MVAVQPIPRNAPSSSDVEAQALLRVHNRGTDGRVKRSPLPQYSRVPGENPGTRVRA